MLSLVFYCTPGPLQVTPLISLLLVLAAMAPACLLALLRPSTRLPALASRLSFVFMSAFLFGWHVHEKAVLHFLLPLALTASLSRQSAVTYTALAAGQRVSVASLVGWLAALTGSYGPWQ